MSVLDAVYENPTRFNAADPQDTSVVATFSHHAIVANEDAEFFRATIVEHDDGSVSIGEVEPVDVPVARTRVEQDALIAEAARDAASAIVSGDFDAARIQVRKLMESSHLVARRDPLVEADEVVSTLTHPDRPWRRVYAENKAYIHKFLWGASGVAYRDAPPPKYRDLYEGRKEAAPYSAAITVDLEQLSTKLDRIWSTAAEAYESSNVTEGAFNGLEIASMAQQFDVFARDFLDEASRVCRLVEDASKDDDEDNAAVRAMIHDRVASRLPELDIASKLVKRTAVEFSG